MTDERMIRIRMEESDYLHGVLLIEDKWGQSREVDIELESAPPEDWKDDMRTLFKICSSSEEAWNGNEEELREIQKKYFKYN